MFYVYENWTRDKAVLHRAECSFCRNGQGLHVMDSGRNGKWHGPFDDRGTAMAAANGLRHSDTRACSVCRP